MVILSILKFIMERRTIILYTEVGIYDYNMLLPKEKQQIERRHHRLKKF